MSAQEIYDAELKKKGYGTIGANGEILNIDNDWRKEHAESEGFDWFGALQNTKAFWQKGFKVHYEDYFASKDKIPFSPLPNNIMSVEGAFLGLLLLKMAKDNPKMLEKLAVKYLDTIGKICDGLVSSGKTHPLIGVHNSTVFATMAHKFGLIDDGGYLKIVDESRNIISVMQQQVTAGLALEGIQTFVEGSKITTTAGEFGVSRAVSGLGLLANVKGAVPT